MEKKHPQFIVFEGIEACGKSTQIRLLSEGLSADGRQVLVLREPGGTEIGERVRAILKDTAYASKMQSETELLLMNAARAQLVREVIRPALEGGQTVICDRYYYSTLAYQGYGRGLAMDSLEAITRYAIGGVKPDVVLFLDISLEESWRRIGLRNAELRAQGGEVRDRFEESGREFYQRVYDGFQRLAQRLDVFRRIDGMESREVVASAVRKVVYG